MLVAADGPCRARGNGGASTAPPLLPSPPLTRPLLSAVQLLVALFASLHWLSAEFVQPVSRRLVSGEEPGPAFVAAASSACSPSLRLTCHSPALPLPSVS